jgi:hypothetical protein
VDVLGSNLSISKKIAAEIWTKDRESGIERYY